MAGKLGQTVTERFWSKVDKTPGHKLTADDVLEIRRQLESGTLQERIANQYAVSTTLISWIKRRLVWKHV